MNITNFIKFYFLAFERSAEISDGETSHVSFAEDVIDNSESEKTNDKIKNRKITGKMSNILSFICISEL